MQVSVHGRLTKRTTVHAAHADATSRLVTPDDGSFTPLPRPFISAID